MAVIGTFAPAKDGGWIGRIHTLMVHRRVRLVPNDNRRNDQAPDYRVYAGDSNVGAAWRDRTGGDRDGLYLHVWLDDPGLPGPVTAAMIAAADGRSARLVWRRRQP